MMEFLVGDMFFGDPWADLRRMERRMRRLEREFFGSMWRDDEYDYRAICDDTRGGRKHFFF